MFFRFAPKSIRPSVHPPPHRSASPSTPSTRRLLLGAAVAILVASAAFPSSADLTDEIEELKEQQAEVKKEREAKARSIDAATAEANDLAAALGVLNGRVNEQEETLAAASERLAQAERRYALATQATVNKIAEIENLKIRVSNRAISAFVDQNLGSTPVLENTAPNQAVRKKTLVESITNREVDAAEQLRAAREDLALEQARADQAAGEAADLRADIAEELDELEVARDEQARLADEAESRLEAQLAEAAVLAERDKEMASRLDGLNKELARQAALARARNNPAPSSQSNPKFPSADEIVNIQGFWVHIDVADELDAMLDAARAANIELGGWGYRDHAAQIRLRKSHCGTSNWAIYHKPSSTCRPPTARPGQSQHELGKAIDFTYNGRTIGSRSSPAFKWLAANAAQYGFYNLPSEPWHWSVNGR